MQLDWQTALVILIEVLAIGYLGRKFLAPAPRRASQRPDVAASALVKKKR